MNSNTLLASLSTITSIWEKRNKDYIDNFIPLFATLLLQKNYEQFPIDLVKPLIEDFEKQFGIKISHYTMRIIIKRATRIKILSKRRGNYYVGEKIADEHDVSQEISEHIQAQNDTVDEFIKYAKSRFDIQLTEDDAKQIILAFVRETDIEMLFIRHNVSSRISEPKFAGSLRQSRYLIHSFFIEASKHFSEVFTVLSKMAIGNILANTLLIKPQNGKTETVKNICFYIDTSILLALIGADGLERESVVKQLLRDIYSYGGKLYIFPHTRDEIYEILDAPKEWIDSASFDPSRANRTTIYLRQKGFHEADVMGIISGVPRIIKDAKIEIVEKPPVKKRKNPPIDAVRLKKIIENQITHREPGFVSDVYKKRTLHYATSILAIFQLRKNNCSILLQDAKHVFLTDNSALARATKIYGQEVNERLTTFPAGITDVYLGTILWVNTSNKGIELTRERLLANCYVAIRPDATLEKHLFQAAEKLQAQGDISPEDFTLVTSSKQNKDLLSEKTLNDPKNIDDSTIHEMIHEIRHKSQREQATEIEESNQELIDQKNKNSEINADKQAFENHLRDFIEKKTIHNTTLRLLPLIILIIILVVAPIFSIFFSTPFFRFISAVAILLNTFLGLIKGVTYKDRKAKIDEEERTKLLKKYGLSDDKPNQPNQ